MKPIVIVLALAVSFVFACGDDAYRCMSCTGSKNDYDTSKDVASAVGADMCFCWGTFTYYTDLKGQKEDQFDKFKNGCFRGL
jgi:hypothetical protein